MVRTPKINKQIIFKMTLSKTLTLPCLQFLLNRLQSWPCGLCYDETVWVANAAVWQVDGGNILMGSSEWLQFQHIKYLVQCWMRSSLKSKTPTTYCVLSTNTPVKKITKDMWMTCELLWWETGNLGCDTIVYRTKTNRQQVRAQQVCS